MLPEHFPAARAALLAWYRAQARPLPWRTQPSLYATVVSEFMLQQTQVAVVLPCFERWMRELPDFHTLATADEQRVLRLWEGLGYYGRAHRLHAAAKWIAEHGAPRDAAGWRKLDGFGPYTAAAVASIACGEAVAVIDGNVARVLARLEGDTTTWPDAGFGVKRWRPLAEELLDTSAPGDFNQAMMELGATVCQPRRVGCTLCPFEPWCAARHLPDPTDVPEIRRRQTTTVVVHRLIVEDGLGRILLHRAPPGGRLGGLHEFPSVECLGLDAEDWSSRRPFAVRRRSITTRRIEERFYRCDAATPTRPDLVWIERDRLGDVPLSGPHRRWSTDLLG